MEIVMRKVSELTPYDKNAKKHDAKQVANVARSIQEMGWKQPLVVDAQGVVIVGHCRLLAAKKLGLKEVPCVVADDLTPEQVKRYRILDNKLAESPWDLGLLAEDMEDLNFDGYDIGFPELEAANDWFESRERWDDSTDGEDDEYKDFLDKFEAKKTTDDCYTPDNVYQAVSEWVAKTYNVAADSFVRPFFPGGDYKKHKYPSSCVVVDNPPFSILSEILNFYQEKGIRFFLFAPALTLFSGSGLDVTYLPAGCTVTYENSATVSTAFVTNMDTVRIRSVPTLYQAVDAANAENLRAMHKELPKYAYPDHVMTAAMGNRYSKYGVDFVLEKEDGVLIAELDAQKEEGKTIFGGGFLLSDRAAAEKAAAENAAAEKAAARQWQLSEREWDIVRSLGNASS